MSTRARPKRAGPGNRTPPAVQSGQCRGQRTAQSYDSLRSHVLRCLACDALSGLPRDLADDSDRNLLGSRPYRPVNEARCNGPDDARHCPRTICDTAFPTNHQTTVRTTSHVVRGAVPSRRPPEIGPELRTWSFLTGMRRVTRTCKHGLDGLCTPWAGCRSHKYPRK